MMVDRFNRADRQYRAEGERHVGCAERIERNGRQRKWQALPAKIGRRVDRSPPVCDIGLVGGHKTFGHHHFAVHQPSADGVADPIERSEFASSKLTDAVDDSLDHIGCRIGKAVVPGQRVDARDMLQYEQLLGDRGGKRHGLQKILCKACRNRL